MTAWTLVLFFTLSWAQAQQPAIVGASPKDGAAGIIRNVFVSCRFQVPVKNTGIDSATLARGIRLYPTESPDKPVPVRFMLSNNMLNLVVEPAVTLASFTHYTFEVTPQLKDQLGNAFIPFKSTFSTSDIDLMYTPFRPEATAPPQPPGRAVLAPPKPVITPAQADSIAEAALQEAEAAFAAADSAAATPLAPDIGTEAEAPKTDMAEADTAQVTESPALTEVPAPEAPVTKPDTVAAASIEGNLTQSWPSPDPAGPPEVKADSVVALVPAATDTAVVAPPPVLEQALSQSWPAPDPAGAPVPEPIPPVVAEPQVEKKPVVTPEKTIPDPKTEPDTFFPPKTSPAPAVTASPPQPVSPAPAPPPVPAPARDPQAEREIAAYENLLNEPDELDALADPVVMAPRAATRRPAEPEPYAYATLNEPDSLAPPRLRAGGLEVVPGESQVVIKWVTTEEFRHGYFRVERSVDGKTYEPVKVITSAGNSDTLRQYVVEDIQPFRGTNHYRLLMVDRVKAKSYLTAQPIQYDGRIPVEYLQKNVLRDGTLHVRFDLDQAQTVTVMVKARNNRIVKRLSDTIAAGQVEKRLSMKGLAPGYYRVGIRAEGKIYVQMIRVLM